MWQTSFYFFGSIGIVWSLIWISLYSEKDDRKKYELPLVIIPQVRHTIIIHIYCNVLMNIPVLSNYT